MAVVHVAVKEVGVAPVLLFVNAAEIWVDCAVSELRVGAPEIVVAGVTLSVLDDAPEPITLAALTLQLYMLPLVRPDTVMGLALPEPEIDPQVAV